MSKPTGRPAGRPTKYNLELGNKICQLIGEGYSLRQIERMQGMPTMAMIMRWASSNKPIYAGFREQYTIALELRCNRWAEEINEIADDGSNDYYERETKTGEIVEVPDKEHIFRSRLRVDSRKWLLSKLQPKKYGDKIQQEITGKDGTDLIPSISIKLKPSS